MADAFDELAGLYFKAGSKAGGVYKKVRARVACCVLGVGWGLSPALYPWKVNTLFFVC